MANQPSPPISLPLFPAPRLRLGLSAQRGITLTELLIAIVLLAFLASLLFTAVKRSRESVQAVKCLSQMRQVAMAVNSWSTENKNLIPVAVTLDVETAWVRKIAPYLELNPDVDERAEILCCPAASSMRPPGSPRLERSYLFNFTIGLSGEPFNYPTATSFRSRFDIKNSATYVMLFDVVYTGTATIPLWHNGNSTWGRIYDKEILPPEEPHEYPRPHYDGRAVNVVFYDGHAARLDYPLPEASYFYDY